MLSSRKKTNSASSVNKMSKTFLKYYDNESDAIRGKRIVIEARKFGKLRVFGDRTSRHKGQRLTADNAIAWIERGYIAGKKL